MQTSDDLRRRLVAIDRRGYPAYKELRGVYNLGTFELSIDHVQGDPFAAPSELSVFVPMEALGLPLEFMDVPHRRIAVEDLLVRRFAREAARVSCTVGGSGRSGLIATSAPGPEVLARSACDLYEDGAVLRFVAGFPAHGRSTDARSLARMLLELVPRCVERALTARGPQAVGADAAVRAEAVRGRHAERGATPDGVAEAWDGDLLQAARAAADLADDQAAVRAELRRRGLVTFVADGAVLPRASGVSARPLAGATPFRSPASLRVVLDLPHRGPTPGMGIPRGVTLIVGGGYHGKSTLLKALQEGVYNHVAGDGRELVVTDATAVKLRAEDGRAVQVVDIAPFISNLPDGRDTRSFSTEDASGSTSQAAGTVEALEAGARVLLMDEDTSATNFMVRDELMEAVVAAEHEPITPFVERVRGLWERRGVSTVLVVGSSGAFFPVADTVLQMDRYEARDVTERVRAVCSGRGIRTVADAAAAGGVRTVAGAPEDDVAVARERDAVRSKVDGGTVPIDALGERSGRRLVLRAGTTGGGSRGGWHGGSHAGGRPRAGAGKDRLKVRVQGRDGFSVGGGSADLRLVEQLVDAEQTAALAQLARLVLERRLLDGSRALVEVVDGLLDELDRDGWEALAGGRAVACGLALPRRQEVFACLNRWRA